jgi:hypothetical protein
MNISSSRIASQSIDNAGNAGDITLSSEMITLNNFTRVTSSSEDGDAGNINFQGWNRANLEDVTIETRAIEAGGGNIIFTGENIDGQQSVLQMRNARLDASTEASSRGDNANRGGTLLLDGDVVLALEGSELLARATHTEGGVIEGGILLLSSDSIVGVESTSGNDGNILFDAIFSDEETRTAWEQLEYDSASALLKNHCSRAPHESISSFTLKGRSQYYGQGFRRYQLSDSGLLAGTSAAKSLEWYACGY